MATMQRRDVLAARADQDVALASESKETILLGYTQIRADGGTQMRAAVNEETAGEYADALRAGATFPPVIVFHDGTDYWLGDGFHRVRAYFMAHGHSARISAEVRSGTRRDAVLCAAGANSNHGLRRTPDDKRRAVETLLRDEEWGQWSDREIARRCSVSHPFVAKLRAELEPTHTGNVTSMQAERTFVHPRTGEPTTMRTENIGTNRPPSVAIPINRVVGKCRRCGRPLTDPASVDQACGPECAAKLAAGVDVEPDSDEAQSATAIGGGPLRADDEAAVKPALPADLVALGCRLSTQDGFFFVSYAGHRETYASLEGAVAWCRRMTGTDEAETGEVRGTRQERIATLLDLYRQTLASLGDYGRLTGDFSGALPARKALETLVTRLEGNVTK